MPDSLGWRLGWPDKCREACFRNRHRMRSSRTPAMPSGTRIRTRRFETLILRRAGAYQVCPRSIPSGSHCGRSPTLVPVGNQCRKKAFFGLGRRRSREALESSDRGPPKKSVAFESSQSTLVFGRLPRHRFKAGDRTVLVHDEDCLPLSYPVDQCGEGVFRVGYCGRFHKVAIALLDFLSSQDLRSSLFGHSANWLRIVSLP